MNRRASGRVASIGRIKSERIKGKNWELMKLEIQLNLTFSAMEEQKIKKAYGEMCESFEKRKENDFSYK